MSIVEKDDQEADVITTDTLADQRVFELSREELDSLPYGVITLDRRGTILRYNYAEAAFARRTSAATLGLGFFTDVAPCTNVRAFRGRFDDFARQTDSGVEHFDFTFAFRWGSQDVSISLLRKAEHEEINLIVRGRTQATLDVAPVARSEFVAHDAGDVSAQSAGMPTPFVGAQEVEYATGWMLGSAEEAAWRATIHPDDIRIARRLVDAASARRGPYIIEYRTITANRKQRVVQEHGNFLSHGNSAGYATVVDVTERRRQDVNLLRLAHYDSITGLPNRALLLDRIAAAASEVRDTDRVAAVLSLIVRRIGSPNDSLRRDTNSELLRHVALRLGESIRGGDTVARLDGDAFAVVLSNVDTLASATATGLRILAAMSEPFPVAGRRYQLSASLGISAAPRNGLDAAALLQAAETAMFVSQQEGRSVPTCFSNDISTEIETTQGVEDELRIGLERDEFVLHYQPIVNIETHRIVAVEALIRWNHPSRGLVMPSDFISVAERMGLIGALGDWVLHDACRQARYWLDLGLDLHVCVNVSTIQFRQPTFVASIASLIAETGIPPRMLELELTESVMIHGFDDVIETLSKLKLIGVRLAIDDFGTGYSSLAYLKYFPIDTLKIDRAFVSDIVEDTFDRAIAKAVITLAADLQVDCIAEGVETPEQLEALRTLGCRRVQGYYFFRPQLPSTLEGRLSETVTL